MSVITVMEAVPSTAWGKKPLMTKIITPTGTKPYDSATFYNAHRYEVSSIHELSMLLTALEGEINSCVVRGRLIDPTKTARIYRRFSDHAECPTLEEQHQPWMLCDFDAVVAPSADMTNQERLDYLVSLLPTFFHGASYHYRWSASAGTKGWEKLSCHIWFWFTEPWDSLTLKERIKVEKWGVDHSVCTIGQPHYVARPIFKDMDDPLPGLRCGLVIGDRDAVDMPMYFPPYVPPPVRTTEKLASPDAGFEERLAAIGPGYHAEISRAIAYYCKVMKDPDLIYLKERVIDAITYAVPGKSPKSHYTNNAYLNRSISGAMAKYH